VTICATSSCAAPSDQQKLVEVEATILVVQKSPNDALGLNSASAALAQDYIGAQLVLVRAPEIIGRAMKNPKVQAIKFPDGVNAEQAIYLVRDALTVRRHPDAKDNVLVVTLTWSNQQEGIDLLRAVLHSYQTFLDETYRSVSDRTLELILEAKRTLTENLQISEQAHSTFRANNPLLVGGSDQAKLQFERLSSVEARKTALSANRVEQETRLGMLEKAVADKNPSVAITLKVNEWAARSGFDKLPQEARQGIDATHAYIAFLKQELDESRASEKALDQLLAIERERAKQYMMSQMQDDRLRNQIVQNRQLLESITKRLSEINLIKDFGGFEARMVAPPRVKKG
jgi:uncharacterized protein involved in exopolysaccharide biosynthesis